MYTLCGNFSEFKYLAIVNVFRIFAVSVRTEASGHASEKHYVLLERGGKSHTNFHPDFIITFVYVGTVRFHKIRVALTQCFIRAITRDPRRFERIPMGGTRLLGNLSTLVVV